MGVTMRSIVILDLMQNPQGGVDNKTTQPTESPSPLMGEESKARVNKPTQPTESPLP